MALTVGCILLQVQRLLELHSYLNGGAKQQPPSSNVDHSSVWRKQQEATAAEVGRDASAPNVKKCWPQGVLFVLPPSGSLCCSYFTA